MTTIIFYEKPGCANNTKQKVLLAAAGHTVFARNLLIEAWTRERLLEFFGDKPVAEWFNRAAPKIKSGEIIPEQVNADDALNLMLTEPLLIRRPLLEVDGRREVGFDIELIDAWLGLNKSLNVDMESCSKKDRPCP
jgi:nitrogenase-associated protein